MKRHRVVCQEKRSRPWETCCIVDPKRKCNLPKAFLTNMRAGIYSPFRGKAPLESHIMCRMAKHVLQTVKQEVYHAYRDHFQRIIW